MTIRILQILLCYHFFRQLSINESTVWIMFRSFFSLSQEGIFLSKSRVRYSCWFDLITCSDILCAGNVCLSAAQGSKGISPNVFPEVYPRTLKAVQTVGSRAFEQSAESNSENFWQESGLNRQRHERSRTSMTTNHTSASHQSTDPKIGSADIWPAWRGADVYKHDCLVHSPRWNRACSTRML